VTADAGRLEEKSVRMDFSHDCLLVGSLVSVGPVLKHRLDGLEI